MNNWRRLVARIRAEEAAIRFSLEGGDTTFLEGRLLATDRLFEEIKRLANLDSLALGEAAGGALREFEMRWLPPGDLSARSLILRERLVELLALAARLEYFVTQVENGRRLTLRAFEHLNRLIAVDISQASLWQKAFKRKGEKQREVACERLGAVHLLWHGVWAFKVYGEGARTDLIAAELNLIDVERKADTLVLTEWKCVTKPVEQGKKAEEGFRQAQSYAVGVLGQLELASPRFVVLVSEKALPALPPENDAKGFLYEFINVVVNPDTPSVAARRR